MKKNIDFIQDSILVAVALIFLYLGIAYYLNLPTVLVSKESSDYVSCVSKETNWEPKPISSPECQKILDGKYTIGSE